MTLPREAIESLQKFKVKSLEDDNRDLVELSAWEMCQPLATVALILKDEKIDKSVMNLLGETDPKRLDTKTLFSHGLAKN